MRIALFTETFLPKIDGVVTIIHQLHERIYARGHEMIIYAPPGAPPSFNGSTDLPIMGTAVSTLPRAPLFVSNVARHPRNLVISPPFSST